MEKLNNSNIGRIRGIYAKISIVLMLLAMTASAQAQKVKKNSHHDKISGAVAADTSDNPGSVLFDSSGIGGYILFAPKDSTTTYLIDSTGYPVHQWASSYTPGMAVYLLPNGNLLRAESNDTIPWQNGEYAGGQISEYTWDGSLVWRYQMVTGSTYQSHDIYPLPNGNVLVDVWEQLTDSVALSLGRSPDKLPGAGYILSSKIVELRPLGDSAEIVWQWRFADHLDSTGANPQLLNINFMGTPMLITINKRTKPKLIIDTVDWIHMNAVTYNRDLDQIMISSRNLNEIYIIDHSTTTKQAAGHSGGRYGQGGDILYRWGNPQAYGAGNKTNQQLFGQHSPYWLEDGYAEGRQIMVNNDGYPDSPTKVNIIKPPVQNGFYMRSPNSDSAFGPVTDSLVYEPPPADNLSSDMRGNAQLLHNGNILIDAAQDNTFYIVKGTHGKIKTQPIIWEYQVADVGGAFRSTHYSASYSGLRYMLNTGKSGRKPKARRH